MKFKIFIATVFIVIAFALWFIFSGEKDAIKTGESDDSSLAILKEEKSEKTDSVSAPPDSASAQIKKYENSQYGFLFNYPSEFKAKEFPEEQGRISLIIQNEKTNQIIQIYITPYDDPDFAVSAERIRRDIPELTFSNSADVVVGGKAKGVAFFSQNEAFGETAEVWFADDSNFFQTTTYRKDVGLLEEIIKSWEFSS